MMLTKKKFLIFSFLLFGLIMALTTSQVTATDNQTQINSTTHQSIQKTVYKENFKASSSLQTIKVLIYNGKNADEDCVEGIKSSLNVANKKRLVPGYYFTYQTSPIINSAVLKYYNVLVVPGGDDYINDDGQTISSINPTAVRNFVASGRGYVGICAGAFSGAKYTKGWYYGWGVAPHVYCKGPEHVGNLSIRITNAGRNIFGYGGRKTTLYWNGPAIYANSKMITFAQYADNIIGSKGMGAIVGDYYGKGRSVLSGPHPELDPQLPDIVSRLIAWAANMPSQTALKVTSTVPTHLKTGVRRKSNISINFNRYIKMNSSFNFITVKNLTTKKFLKIFKTIAGNVLTIKTESKSAYNWFQVTIPAKAVKDSLGRSLTAAYNFQFRTGTLL
jgi:glutamine amidotransferase-like uncharacterized protein